MMRQLFLFAVVVGSAACSTPTPERARGEPVQISVTDHGFEPTPVKVKQGEPVKLVVTRKTDQTCATEIVIDEYGIDAKLPLNTPVEVTFTPTKTGELRYGCSMNKMVSGVLLVD